MQQIVKHLVNDGMMNTLTTWTFDGRSDQIPAESSFNKLCLLFTTHRLIHQAIKRATFVSLIVFSH